MASIELVEPIEGLEKPVGPWSLSCRRGMRGPRFETLERLLWQVVLLYYEIGAPLQAGRIARSLAR